jgi:ADP-heptose:LPS heptosyltransferase
MKPLRILVVRNDKLGDFMLAWPALALLKRSLPHCHIAVLVPHYTYDLATQCPWVDQVLCDPQDMPQVTRHQFDAVLTLFSTVRVGWQVFKGRIPLRMAPATKWAQVFYNRRVVQRRSRSLKPEFEYNLDLAHALLRELSVPPAASDAPYWPVSASQQAQQRELLAQQLGLNAARPWYFVHSGSGGSANNLSVDQFAQLVVAVQQQLALAHMPLPQWVLTCGPGEDAQAQALHDRIAQLGQDQGQDLGHDSIHSVVYRSTQGLAPFALSLCTASVLVAGSTGPLHVAGALNVPTVGFFPAKRSATPLRWQPCNASGRTLAFSPSAATHEAEATNMASINVVDCAPAIVKWLRGLGA